jgi:hypothetical protein
MIKALNVTSIPKCWNFRNRTRILFLWIYTRAWDSNKILLLKSQRFFYFFKWYKVCWKLLIFKFEVKSTQLPIINFTINFHIFKVIKSILVLTFAQFALDRIKTINITVYKLSNETNRINNQKSQSIYLILCIHVCMYTKLTRQNVESYLYIFYCIRKMNWGYISLSITEIHV